MFRKCKCLRNNTSRKKNPSGEKVQGMVSNQSGGHMSRYNIQKNIKVKEGTMNGLRGKHFVLERKDPYGSKMLYSRNSTVWKADQE